MTSKVSMGVQCSHPDQEDQEVNTQEEQIYIEEAMDQWDLDTRITLPVLS